MVKIHLFVILFVFFLFLDANMHFLTAQQNTPDEEEKIQKVLAWIGTRRYEKGGDSRMDYLSASLNKISGLQKKIEENPTSASGKRNEIRTILNDIVQNSRYRKLYRDLIKTNTGIDLNFVIHPHFQASIAESRMAADKEKINALLKEKNSLLITQIEEKEKTIRGLLQKIKELEDKSDSIDSVLSSEFHDFDRFNHQLVEKTEETERLNTQLKGKAAEIKRLQTKGDELKIELDVLNAQLEERDHTLTKLKEESNSYHHERLAVVETLEAKNGEIIQLKSAIVERMNGETKLLKLDKEHYEFIVAFEELWQKTNSKYSLNVLLSVIGTTALVTFFISWAFLRRRS